MEKAQWTRFWVEYAETIGVAAAFAFGGSAFVLWVTPASHEVKRGILVIIAGQIVTAATIAFMNGYLGWSIFIAPVVGIVCGIVAMPILNAIMKGGHRVEDRADDIADAVIKRGTGATGKELKP